MKKTVMEVAVLSILAAIPTALGYVLGPLSRAFSAVSGALGVPIAPRLGFIPLVTSTVLARAYLGRGAAVKEGALLALLGMLFHPRDLSLRLPRNFMLGVGVELAMLGAGSIDKAYCVVAGVAGGLLSYTPYLLFTPWGAPSAALYLTILLSSANWLLSCAIGGYIAAVVLERVSKLHLNARLPIR
ncbi:MAG: hypothetical protein N3E41_03655 [Thermofilaceae archaeon]|nr:hypothetical protein [Thermofilaceae archaeon]MDW8003341.1 hypothetical protein [Thermofilaceae archaeon]